MGQNVVLKKMAKRFRENGKPLYKKWAAALWRMAKRFPENDRTPGRERPDVRKMTGKRGGESGGKGKVGKGVEMCTNCYKSTV